MPKAECIIKKYILSATKNVFSVDTEGRGTNLYNNRSIQYPNTIIDCNYGHIWLSTIDCCSNSIGIKGMKGEVTLVGALDQSCAIPNIT